MVKEMWSSLNDGEHNNGKQRDHQSLCIKSTSMSSPKSRKSPSSSSSSPIFKTPTMVAPRYKTYARQLLMAPKMKTKENG